MLDDHCLFVLFFLLQVLQGFQPPSPIVTWTLAYELHVCVWIYVRVRVRDRERDGDRELCHVNAQL